MINLLIFDLKKRIIIISQMLSCTFRILIIRLHFFHYLERGRFHKFIPL